MLCSLLENCRENAKRRSVGLFQMLANCRNECECIRHRYPNKGTLLGFPCAIAHFSIAYFAALNQREFTKIEGKYLKIYSTFEI